MTEGSHVGTARSLGLLSGGLGIRLSYALIGIASALVLFAIAGTNPAFAEAGAPNIQDVHAFPQPSQSYARQVADSVGVASQFNGPASRDISPRTFTIGISESISVASNFGNPSAPGQSYNRALSESVGINTGFTSPQSQTTRNPESTSRPAPIFQTSGQRIEERLNLKNISNTKAEVVSGRSYSGGTSYTNTEYRTESPPATINNPFEELQSLLGDDGGSSDDTDGHSLRILSTIQPEPEVPNQSGPIVQSAIYGVYGIAIIAIVIVRSPTFVQARRRVAGVLKPAGQSRPQPYLHVDSHIARIIVIVVVATATIAVMSSMQPIFVSAFADTNAAAAVYRSNTGTNGLNSPKYREWNPSTSSWSSEVELGSVGAGVRDAKLLFSPTSNLRAVVAFDASGGLNLFYCSSSCTTAGSWTGPTSVDSLPTPDSTKPYRPFDIAFEQSSGKLVIVYDKSGTNVFFKTFSGSTLSSATSLSYGTGEVRYIKMASKIGANDIAMILLDATAGKSTAYLWNGSSFDNPTSGNISATVGTTSITGESIGIAYERASGVPVAFSGNGADSALVKRYVSNAWSTATNGTVDTDNTASSGNHVKFVTVKSDPASTSNKVMICVADSLSQASCGQEDGGTLPVASSWTQVTSNLASTSARSLDFAWNPSGSNGIVAWAELGKDAQAAQWNGSTFGNTVNSAITAGGTLTFNSGKNNGVTNGLYVTATGLAVSTVGAYTGTVTYKQTIQFNASNTPKLVGSLSPSFSSNPSTSLHAPGTSSGQPQLVATPVSGFDVGANTWVIQVAITFSTDAAVSSASLGTIRIDFATDSSSVNVPNGQQKQVGLYSTSVLLTNTSQTNSLFAMVPSQTNTNGNNGSNNRTTKVRVTVSTSGATTGTLTIKQDVGFGSTPSLSSISVAAGTTGTGLTLSGSPAITTSGTNPVTFTITQNFSTNGAIDTVSTGDFTISFTSSTAYTSLATTSGSPSLVATQLTSAVSGVTITTTGSVSGTITLKQQINFASSTTLAAGTPSISGADSSLALGTATVSVSPGIASSTQTLTITIPFYTTAAVNAVSLGTVSTLLTLGTATTVSSSSTPSGSPAATVDEANWIASATNPTSADTLKSMWLGLNRTFKINSLKYDGSNLAPAGWQTTTGSSVNTFEGMSLDFQKVSILVSSRSVSDTLTVTDSISAKVTKRAIPNSITISDSISAKVTKRAISVSVSITDNSARKLFAARATADTVMVADSIKYTLVASRQISDSAQVTDSITSTVSLGRSIVDSTTIVDSVVSTVASSTSISDTIAVSDSIFKTNVFNRSISDTLTATEDIATTLIATRSTSDTVTTIDSATAIYLSSRNVSDGFSISDEMTAEKSYRQNVSDTLATSDSISYTLLASRPADDSVEITDSAGAVYFASRSISDSVVISDAITAGIHFDRSVADSVTAAESVTTAITRDISDDAISFRDSITTSLVADRSVSDSLSLAETTTMGVSRSVSDSVSVLDEVEVTNIFARGISNSISLSDVPSPELDALRGISDTVASSDGVERVFDVDRSIDDTITITTQTLSGNSYTKEIGDELTTSDEPAVTLALTRSASENVGVSESSDRLLASSRSLSDSLTFSDVASVSNMFDRTVADSMETTEGVGNTNYAQRSAVETLDISDTVSPSVIFDRQFAESIEVGDTLPTSVSRSLDDVLAISDSLSAGYPGTANETLPISDSLQTLIAPGNVSDSLSLGEFVSIGTSRAITDTIATTDIIGNPIRVDISDSMAIGESVDENVQGRTVEINDSVTVGAQLSEVSVIYNLNLGEPLTLQDCTPLSCNQSLHFDEGLNLADDDFFTSPPGRILTTSVAVTDSIAVNRPQTFISLNDSAGVSIAIKPLLPILVNDRPDSYGRPSNLSIPGNYTWDGTPASLRDNLKLEPLYFNTTVSRDNLPNQVVTLRLWNVNIAPTAGLPATSTLVSDRAANIPAGVPVQARINFKDTPSLSGHSNFIKSLDVQFTPAMLTTDFGLIVTPMDAPPGGATLPPEDLRPLYLDVKWWGNVPGGSDPSVASYYQHPPTFTFTVNDDWANSESAARDGNGVPIIKIRLLNETTNQWDEINAIQRPDSGKDGTYIFTATLPHFSDYVITAVKSAAVSPGPGSSHHTPLPVPQTFAVDLSDKLGVATTSASKAVSVIEEFAGEKFSANLLDSVVISSKPVAYNTFKILKGVEVSITVVDVKQESMVPPSATALLQTEITNTGDEAEKFTLNYWYNDQMGKRGFDLSQQVEVEAHGKKTLQVMIPFTEPGSYRVTAEARSVPENNLLESTQLTVVVPWLSVYLFVLIAAIAAILGGSAIAIALYMARNGMMIATGTAGGAIILLGRKGKLRVRVAEKGTADGDNDDDYDLLVNVKLANSGEEGRLAAGQHTALFDFEIINKSTRKQEFVLAYHLVDVAGTVLPESVQRVKIAKRKTQIRNARLELLAGAYVLHVEARTAKGEVLSSNHVSVRTS